MTEVRDAKIGRARCPIRRLSPNLAAQNWLLTPATETASSAAGGREQLPPLQHSLTQSALVYAVNSPEWHVQDQLPSSQA